jgi:hypothetical protein
MFAGSTVAFGIQQVCLAKPAAIEQEYEACLKLQWPVWPLEFLVA